MLWWLAYIALGLFTGLFAGMLGIGGGLLMVPTLTMMFAAQAGFPATEVLHLALGTSMAAILFTSLASLRAHHQHQAVLWKVVGQITPGILAGTLIGTLFAGSVPSRPLALFFMVFVCVVAVQMILDLKPKASRELPGAFGVFGVGTGIGALSALVAIGGGSLTVPFLTWCNVRVQHAIGTSAAVGFPIAIGGSLGYIFNGWEHPGLPPWSVGYVYLPALLWLVPSSMLIAPLGARLAHRLPVATLKRLFAAILILLAAKMMWGLSV
ncbi:sulfite exporter TauE/SafE family protein [Candidatus Accumulibacter phosphatis]|uniref:Probable membrane transporter protein n=1 Tax=Candidatus Accumulibacter phosphatis TaxID=327160 RepID=A0ABX1TW25_9PROT|nr:MULTISPECIES: sulfite exporter TauE/SafE family protein [Candidatus Accumulibacter]NMQ26913.1 sulfite exporter TauE/SafE family protein [Candidatus Accumulibacter phosphatis]